MITTPNNPSGKVWSQSDLQRVTEMCRTWGTYLIVDQTYFEFVYPSSKHSFPCSSLLQYDRIIHIFSFSKIFGMAGWRVGFFAFPSFLTAIFRKIQDALPTCAPIASQMLALHCLEVEAEVKNRWFASKMSSLLSIREKVFQVVKRLGTVKTEGAFYFLLPLPPFVSEEEAIDILAREFKVLLMYGHSFGATHYLRLSYGSLNPERVDEACGRLAKGISRLMALSAAKDTHEEHRRGGII